MSPGYLVLHPEAPNQAVAPKPLLKSLRELGLIDQQEDDATDRYRTGHAYLKLITYLGCSPSIPLADDQPAERCHLRLAGPYPVPALISGSNTRPPRCPGCNHPFSEWKEWLSGSKKPPLKCKECSGDVQLERLKWREQAAMARLFLLISHVFPGEAVPVERLMLSLRGEGTGWHHAYVQQPCIWRPDTGWEEIGS